MLDYYKRFLEEAPDVSALAALPEERLMKLWQGLGYYSRARNLKKAAKIIVEEYGGQFPSDYAAVRALPGVGDYTAGAICSIAFGQAVPAVDGDLQPGPDGAGGHRVPAQRRAAVREVPGKGLLRRPGPGPGGGAACEGSKEVPPSGGAHGVGDLP